MVTLNIPEEFSKGIDSETVSNKAYTLSIPEEFEPDKYNLNIDFEDDSARLYDKPRTDIINDIRYGWNQSQAGFFHLAANVPGGLNSIKEFASNVPGLGFLDKDGILASMEGYLRDLSDAQNPENQGLDTPDTLTGKILSGFAMAPITVAEYYGPMRLLKSLPMAMALVDGIRESDKGLSEAAIAAGKGAIMGKLIEASSVLRLPERMGALGALGFTTAGGGVEDRIAGGVVFGTLGALGPVRGKSIKDVKQSLLGENSQVRKVQQRKATEWVILNEKLGETDLLINKQEAKIEKYRARTKVNKTTLEGYQKELSTLLDSRLKTKDSMDAIGRALHTTEKLANEMYGKDPRTSIEVLSDLFNRDGTKKYNDLEGMKHKMSGYAFPMKFITKNPITKWMADYMSDIRVGIESKVEMILHDPKISPLGFGKTRVSVDKLLSGETNAFNIGITALRKIHRENSDGAAFTRFEALYRKDWRQVEDVIQKSFKIEVDKAAEAKKKKTKIKDVTDTELKNKYKLNQDQINVYKDLRTGLDTVHKFYNDYIKKYVKTIPDAKAMRIATELPYIPNYMPHMFLGDYRVWVNKKTNPNKDPVHIAPANSPWSANKFKKELEIKFPKKDYIVKVEKVNRSNISNRGIKAFEELIQYAERMKKSDISKEMHDLYTKTIAGRGFRKHSLRRKNIPGQAGTREGLGGVLDFKDAYQIYVRGGVQKAYTFKARKETNHLVNNKDVMSKYINARTLAVKYRENALGAEANKISDIIRNVSRKWVGESGIENALGMGNRLTLNLKLLFFNLRYMAASAIQPFQMIPSKLLHLEAKGIRGDTWRSVIEAQRSLVLPDRPTTEFIEYMVKKRVVEPKFLDEFAKDTSFKSGKFSIGKNFVLDIPKILDIFTFKKWTGRVESYSRLNAGLMFYHFLKRSGKSQKEAMREASYLADKYMVEYNSFEKPLIYGEAGLGTAGKPFGLFKTFQHNYFAQMTEHFQSIKWNELKGGDLTSAKSSLGFLGTMIVTAGALNVIGIEIADKLINSLTPVWERVFGKRPQTATEMLLRSDLPDWVKWGAPSAAVGADLTTTLAAPGLGIQDLVSVPSLEVLGLHPGQVGVPLFKERKGGVLQAGFGWAYKTTMGMATEADAQKFYKSVAPTSFQGVIEAYYNGGVGVFFDKDKSVIINDPWKKGRGKVRRDLDGWLSRLMSSYSLEEATALKTIYSLSVIDRAASNSQQSVVETAAHLALNGEAIPRFLFDMAITNNVPPETFLTQIKNRIKLMNTSLIEREIKKKNMLRLTDTYDLIMPIANQEFSQRIY